MDLTRVIIGPVVTEKAERQKAGRSTGSAQAATHVYSVKVTPKANKIDIRRAVESLYGVEVAAVRIIKIQPKTRELSAHSTMEKRHSGKKALLTLKKGSKALDLTSIDTTSKA